MSRRRLVPTAAILVLSGSLVAGSGAPAGASVGPSWVQVGAGSLNNISGMAPAASGWVVIRDNKLAGQNRISLLDDNAKATALTWPGPLPADLESVDRVPGRADAFAAVTSAGKGTIVEISGTTVSIDRSFVLPNAQSGVEAFALATAGTATVAVWATRGSTTAPAKVSAATFTPSTGVFGKVVTGKVSVPYPTTAVRQVSDVKIVAGRLVISSASDPGNSGPFTSALYDVGRVSVTGGKAVLALAAPVSLGQFPGHKVEAIACSGSTGMLGSDDEKNGAWVRSFDFCG
jgi:hypothetical protein